MPFRRSRSSRRWLWSLVAVVAIAVAAGLAALWRHGLAESRRLPVVREATLALSDWPAGAPPVRVLLLADFHVGNASTDFARLAAVARAGAALRPDFVLFAGDVFAGYDAATMRAQEGALAAALAPLRPPLGRVAILGNHDNEGDRRAVVSALRHAGFAVGENMAIRRGPIVLGLAGDTVSGRFHSWRLIDAMRKARRRGPGATVILSHSADLVRWLPPEPAVVLTGHSHCGQIVLPPGLSVPPSSTFGNRFRCGRVRYDRLDVVVTGGVGTSNLPLRLNAPPDIWLLTLGPVGRSVAPHGRVPNQSG